MTLPVGINNFPKIRYFSFKVSDIMKEIGFKHVLTPGGLERQLQNSDKVTEIKMYKNETD